MFDLFLASYSRTNVCFTAGKPILVWNCHATCEHLKKTNFTSLVHMVCGGGNSPSTFSSYILSRWSVELKIIIQNKLKISGQFSLHFRCPGRIFGIADFTAEAGISVSLELESVFSRCFLVNIVSRTAHSRFHFSFICLTQPLNIFEKSNSWPEWLAILIIIQRILFRTGTATAVIRRCRC
jgi:hypothetical protein